MIEAAKRYLEQGLSVIPTGRDKSPTIKTWKEYQTQAMKLEEAQELFKGAQAIAVLGGTASQGLEVVDVDTKNDLTGTLGADLLQLLQDNLEPQQYQAIKRVSTPSGGHHLYYRCKEGAANSKLASRPTTHEERAKNPKEKQRVLIETRGNNGYVLAPPSPGYIHTAGPEVPGEITPETRQAIWAIAQSFNEVQEPEATPRYTAPTGAAAELGSSPFKDYNSRGDAVALLGRNGWRVVSQQGDRINLKRPGDTQAKTSGNYHLGHRKLWVFSTSTEFNPEQSYSPADIYTLLECQGDTKLAYRRLLEQGYGTASPVGGYRPSQVSLEQVTVVNTVNSASLAEPGAQLKVEQLEGLQEVEIQSPGPQAYQEVIRALQVLRQGEQLQKIYIREDGHQYSVWEYQLQRIASTYADTDLEPSQRDNLLEDIVTLGSSLEPLERALLVKQFLTWEGVQEMGITQEALDETISSLSKKADQKRQQDKLARALYDSQQLLDQGKPQEAIKALQKGTKEAQGVDRAAQYSRLLEPNNEAEVIAWSKVQPGGVDSGYAWKGEPLVLPGGAITVIAAATNHGKTAVLINLALNALEIHQDKSVLFLTYEESDKQILQYALNTYLDMPELSLNNRKTLRDYFRGKHEFIARAAREEFNHKKEQFFRELITPGRLLIKYPELDTQGLGEFIQYAKKKNPSLGAVYVDYFQLLKLAPGEAKRNGSRQEELKEICLQLKDTAVETGLPIILAAQFNREVGGPHLVHPTNVGEAGDIERIVNTLLGLWNYGKPEDTAKFNREQASDYNKKKQRYNKCLEVQLLKSRELPTGGCVYWDYSGNTGKITHREQEEEAAADTSWATAPQQVTLTELKKPKGKKLNKPTDEE
jgi:hypothetical protein